MSRGTDRRTVRIAPELWEATLTAAAERGEHVSDVIRRALETYSKGASRTSGLPAGHVLPCTDQFPCDACKDW